MHEPSSECITGRSRQYHELGAAPPTLASTPHHRETALSNHPHECHECGSACILAKDEFGCDYYRCSTGCEAGGYYTYDQAVASDKVYWAIPEHRQRYFDQWGRYPEDPRPRLRRKV